jgi:hypothetical protein
MLRRTGEKVVVLDDVTLGDGVEQSEWPFALRYLAERTVPRTTSAGERDTVTNVLPRTELAASVSICRSAEAHPTGILTVPRLRDSLSF